MKKKSIVIGRSTKADLLIEKDKKMSRNHARLELNSEGVPVLYDLGSQSGIIIDGKRVSTKSLKDGMSFQLGDTTFSFVVQKKL